MSQLSKLKSSPLATPAQLSSPGLDFTKVIKSAREFTGNALGTDKPSQVVAMLAVNKATPIRSDTKVGLEFQGLTGVASVSLKGVSATTPLIEREEGEPPTLKADPSASQDMMQAARDVLNRAEEVIAANQEAIRQAVKDIATFSASLARNSDNVDVIVSDAKDTMKNAKEATASARTLMENLDKRTEEITVGVNRMTSTATRQIDIAGRAITDLAHNPQRFLFGGSGSSSSSSTTTPAPAPARTTTPPPAPARTPTPPPAPARAQR